MAPGVRKAWRPSCLRSSPGGVDLETGAPRKSGSDMKVIHSAKSGVLAGSAVVSLVCSPMLFHRMASGHSAHDATFAQTTVPAEKPRLDVQDTFADGTPDFLRLNSAPDQQA